MYAAPARHDADYSNTKELGSVLYTDYVYPFEIASVILLVAIIAAIALTMRSRPKYQYQNPAEQVAVRKAGSSTDRQNESRNRETSDVHLRYRIT